MFKILGKSLTTGVVTTKYPEAPPEVSSRARGRPEIDWLRWADARPAAAVCPTGAISFEDGNGERTSRLDLGSCIFCGLCAEADTTIRMTSVCEGASRGRSDLVTSAVYRLTADGTHNRMITPPKRSEPQVSGSLEELGLEIQRRSRKMFGRSLHIREVDAGSCNGC